MESKLKSSVFLNWGQSVIRSSGVWKLLLKQLEFLKESSETLEVMYIQRERTVPSPVESSDRDLIPN